MPVFRLTRLPIEILEQIVLHLPTQDLIKAEAISRQFQDLTRSSPTLQHRRDLFSAGLIDNLCNPCDFAQRRKLFEAHERKWSNAGRLVKVVHELPEGQLSVQHTTTILGRHLFASHIKLDDGLTFVRVPPAASRVPIERWSIPPLPFKITTFTTYPPDNILVVAEENEQFICIHILNLLDGSPYCALPSNPIMCEIPRGASEVSVQALAITSSRVMMHVCCWEAGRQPSVTVWDWKTGDLVLDLPSTGGSTTIERGTKVTFLDEFRMVVLTPQYAHDTPEFTLFDTLAPRGHPVNSRRFLIPSRYDDWHPNVYVDGDRYLGTPDRGRSLATDPNQAVFVVELVSSYGKRVLLIVRVQTLIEDMCSVNANACVPWGEWGRGAAVMEIPQRSGTLYPSVQGVHVTMLKLRTVPGICGYHPHLCTFDFSRRGYSVLPLLDEGDGAERRALFEDGRDLLFQENESLFAWGLDLLGDSNFMSLDKSCHSGSVLHVWELV